ncbi:MAG: CSLREA domain-containing protein [Nitrospinota bacterium]|nr:CSLREA domain-containing protein [Nitrospinota bacterium]
MSAKPNHTILSLLTLFLISTPPTLAAVITVSTTADTVVNDGSCSLREAVNNVNSVGADTTGGDCVTAAGGDTISVPAGIYILTGELSIAQTATVQGAGAASTVIDANLNGRAINSTGPALTIVGVTIKNGFVNCPACGGGGVRADGDVTVTNCIFTGNNSATDIGGGVYSMLSVTITGSTFSGNTANAGGGVYGTGVTVSNSTISGNTGRQYAAGIGSGAVVNVTSSTISGNSTPGQGGGIYSTGTLTITSSTISGNSGLVAAGVYAGGVLNITSSTISGNMATGPVGGIIVNAGGTVANSTIYGNSATSIGGIWVPTGTLKLSHSIFAGNTGQNCSIGGAGGFSSLGYNIASDGTCWLTGTGDIPNSATIAGSLSPLANNGGATQTHALLPGSPAIDTGNCSFINDQRGVSRPRDGNADKLARCDIGAFEYSTGTNPHAYLNLFYIGTGSVSDGITGSAINPCVPVVLVGCKEYYDSGATITLTATPGAGQQFMGWAGTSASIQNPLTLPKTTYHNITASFGANGLQVALVGPGTVTGANPALALDCPANNCHTLEPPGTALTLTATPTGAAVFTGWTLTSGIPDANTCTAATTPCAVTTPAAGGVVTLTARFDLYGCTSATATNYNPSATINDGSCTFPASGGGGGGGLDNQPPYYPGGGPWLISPENKANGNGDTPFVWRKLTDLDGDTVTYYLYACSGADFADCKVIDMVVGNGDDFVTTRLSYGMGASGAALLLIGFGFTHGGRRRIVVLIAALVLTSSAVFVACGAGGGSGNNGVTVTACADAAADALCREKFNLAPGDYQWKVLADDGRGGQADSESRAFTVK